MENQDCNKKSREFAIRQQTELEAAGIPFTPTSFADYVMIGDTCFNLDSLDAEEITESLESGDYGEDLEEVVFATCGSSSPEFEYCTNGEWLELNGNWVLDGDQTNDDNSQTDWDSFKEHLAKLSTAFPGIEFTSARGQRCLLDQWNGAGFKHRNRGVATFCLLTEEAEKLFNSI